MKLKTGDYAVYRLFNAATEDFTTEFFLPCANLARWLDKKARLADLRAKGYVVQGVVCVDHETYLNLRINDTIEDYCYEDRMEQDYRLMYRRGQISREVYIDTMKAIQDYKWTCLKRLDMQMRRIQSHDYDCYNEVALQLYDKFLGCLL